jgi:hypothetical protein
MVYCDKGFGLDGLAIVPTVDGRWIVITVAVKSSSSNTTVSTAAVDVPDVLLNCGAAFLCNGYRRPLERGSGGAGTGAGGAAGVGGAVPLDKHAVPVVFSGSADEEGVAVVQALMSSGRVAGFLRLQVVLPCSGDATDSAFKEVAIGKGSFAQVCCLRRQTTFSNLSGRNLLGTTGRLGCLVRVLCRVLHVHVHHLCISDSFHVPPPLATGTETVDASDLVHAPVLFAADAEMGLPCVEVNVHEGTLVHLCSLHPTLTPLKDRLVAARLINADAPLAAPKGTKLSLRV